MEKHLDSILQKSKSHAFALIDCNNFYASCERLFRPDLINKPVVILSNNDGCAVAMSNEAKKLGIKIGTPYYQIEELIKRNNIAVFSSNYALYGNISKRVMEVIGTFSSDIEIYSIDESFILLDGIKKDFTEYGHSIKNSVFKCTGIPVTVGIGNTKTLAKAASKLAKKNKIYNSVFNFTSIPNPDDYLKDIDVSDVWGIGYQHTKKLYKLGITTAKDLKYLDDSWVKKNLSGVTTLRTVWELRGISCIKIEQITPPRQEIVSSRSFGESIQDINSLMEALSSYITRAAEKLRRQKSMASVIHVFIHTNRFKDEPQYFNIASTNLPRPSSYTPYLIKYGNELLNKIYKEGFKYKKIGVIFTEIVPEQNTVSLFSDSEEDSKVTKTKKLAEVIDALNTQYGQDTIAYASTGIIKAWNMRRNLLSPRYTTNWDEILTVK